MSDRIYTGADVDLDALAESLYDLAGAIESREVSVVRARDGVQVDKLSELEASVSLSYQVPADREDLLRPIEVDGPEE